MIAHIGGLPLEEVLPALLGGGGTAGLVFARSWMTMRLRRRPEARR